MKSNFGEAFLLQVRDDALAKQVRRADDVQHLLMIVAQKCKLETIFGRVNGNRTWSCGTVEAMYGLAFDASQVNWVVERTNDTVIAVSAQDISN